MAPGPNFRLDEPATISEQFRSFHQQVVLKEEDRARIEAEIRDDLKPLANDLGPFDMNLFGSMLTGVALVGSDMDLNITDGTSKSPSTKVKVCAKALESDANFKVVEAVSHTKVPLIIAFHKPTQTKLDISFDNRLGKENGVLLKYYFTSQPRFLEVMQVIIFWAKKQGICEGRMAVSSYGWNLLYVAYLQTLKFPDGSSAVPAVYKMQPEESASKRLVRGCRVDFDPPALRTLNLTELEILNGFFQYYKDFSFNKDVVCPFLGTKVARFGYGPVPGSDYQRLAQYVSGLRSHLTESGRCRYLRIIQDPFDRNSFMICPTGAVSSIQGKIRRAATVCEEALKSYKHDPEYSSRFLETLFS